MREMLTRPPVEDNVGEKRLETELRSGQPTHVQHGYKHSGYKQQLW